MSATYFPFTAIVGQERLKQALLLNAVNPQIGGLLVRGPSGTGKSTAVRGLAAVLPEIEVVEGCPFSCDPRAPECASCQERAAAGETLPVARRPRRIVNLPLNATEDRVAGSIDLGRALNEGVRALEPGLLAEANRGILYVDEINLLDDHLSDLLLDAAALGINVVEREGVAVSHPARFLLVGTMNPDEGDLRMQIADRIGLHVDVDALLEPAQRAEIMRRREAFGADPAGMASSFAPSEQDLRGRLAAAASTVARVQVAGGLYEAIAALVTRLGITSHRADITVLQCAKGLAALAGRDQVEHRDLRDAAALALGHRVSADAFGPPPALDERELDRVLEDVVAGEIRPGKAESSGPAVPSAPSPR